MKHLFFAVTLFAAVAPVLLQPMMNRAEEVAESDAMISEAEAIDLLLEGSRYDVHAAQLAVRDGNQEIAKVMINAIARVLVLAATGGIKVSDLSVPSLEALCFLNSDEQLEALLSGHPIGSVAKTFLERNAIEVE